MLERIKITNASGIKSTKCESLKNWWDAGVDAVVTKTCTFNPRQGYSFPNAAKVGKSVYQAMGLPNPGYKEMAKIAERLSKKGIKLIFSFTTANEDELKEIVRYTEKFVFAFEFNVSCPHVSGLGSSLGYDFEKLKGLCEVFRESTEKPIGIKRPYYPDDGMLRKAIDATSSLNFYTDINSMGKVLLLNEGGFVLSHDICSFSGPAIKPFALGQIYRTRKLGCKKFIFGCGGIVDANDVSEYLQVGANAVQLGTGMLRYESLKDFVKAVRTGFDLKPISKDIRLFDTKFWE